MRSICVFLVLALFSSAAWARSSELSRAIDLYESGQLSQARDQLRLLVDKRHFSERDRIQARLYLAATDLALQDPDKAREQLTVLAKEHPKVRPDPSVFSPELVVLADQIRDEVAQQRASGHGGKSTAETKTRAEKLAEARAAEKQKQAEAQAAAEKQKQAEARAAAEKQKQAEARAAAEKQKQAEAQAAAEKQQQAEAQAAADQQHPAEAQQAPRGEGDAVASAPTQPDLNPRLKPSSPLETQEAPAVDHRSRRTWGYVALGVAAGAAAVGAIFASGAKSDAEKAASATVGQDYKTAKDDAESKASVASASFIAAGLAAAGGGVLIGTSF